MAESESGADKSENPQRNACAIPRERAAGAVPRTQYGSGDVGRHRRAAGVGGGLAQTLMAMMQGTFELSRETLLDEGAMVRLLMGSGLMALEAIMPLLIALLIASIVGPVALGGWLFSAKAMAPRSAG